MTKVVSLRAWQAEAVDKALVWYKGNADRHFVVNAAPGAGKTMMAAALIIKMFEQGMFDRIVVIAPRDEVVRQWAKTIKSVTGRHVGKITAADGLTVDEAHDDIAITWSSVKNLTALMSDICKHHRVLLIADEIHHAALQNVWGQEATSAFANARYVLALTGTPVRADGDVVWISDHIAQRSGGCYNLSYGDSIRFGYCVPAVFHRHTASFIYGIMGRKFTIDRNTTGETGDSVIDQIIKKAASYDRLMYDCVVDTAGQPVIPSHHSTMIDWAITKLNALRADKSVFGKSNAGAMFVAPDIPTADHIAVLIKKMTGEDVAVVHSMTPKPAKVIKDFRKSDTKWIVSVDMLSEGVDIPRLRVMVCLSRAKTELRFRQLIGRVIRKDDHNDSSRAYIIMPDFLVFDEFAKRIEEEMPTTVDDDDDHYDGDDGVVDRPPPPPRDDPWVCIDGHHNDGGRTCVTCGVVRYTVHMTWEQSSGWRDKATAIIVRGMEINDDLVSSGEANIDKFKDVAQTDAILRRAITQMSEEAIAVVGKVWSDINNAKEG